MFGQRWMIVGCLVLTGTACSPSSPEVEPEWDSGGAAEFRLVPDTATVRAGSTLRVEVQQCILLGDVALETTCSRLGDGSLLRAWSVNGRAGGDAAAGTVTATGATATYTAPSEVPAGSPVAVSVEVVVPGRSKVILVSNVRVVPGCPAPICEYAGTAWAKEVTDEGSMGFEVRGEASVRWLFARMEGSTALYVPAGRVSAAWKTATCSIKLTPPEHTFDVSESHGVLRVSFSGSTISYNGTGASEWGGSQLWTCPNSDPYEIEGDAGTGVMATWFTGEGVALEGGTLLQGTSSTPTGSSGWTFRAVR